MECWRVLHVREVKSNLSVNMWKAGVLLLSQSESRWVDLLWIDGCGSQAEWSSGEVKVKVLHGVSRMAGLWYAINTHNQDHNSEMKRTVLFSYFSTLLLRSDHVTNSMSGLRRNENRFLWMKMETRKGFGQHRSPKKSCDIYIYIHYIQYIGSSNTRAPWLESLADSMSESSKSSVPLWTFPNEKSILSCFIHSQTNRYINSSCHITSLAVEIELR